VIFNTVGGFLQKSGSQGGSVDAVPHGELWLAGRDDVALTRRWTGGGPGPWVHGGPAEGVTP
jgi:hypothetical protein